MTVFEIFLLPLFVIINSILFYFIRYETDKNVLFMNFIILIGVSYINIFAGLEYLFFIFIFIILFIV